MPEVDGYLQLMSFVHQPKTLGFKTGVNVHELFPKPAQRTHRLPEELVTDGTPLAHKLEHATRPVLHTRSR